MAAPASITNGRPLAAEVDQLTWYHTIELPGGVVTPGEYDTRRALAKTPFPASLAGRRCLDVGTHDGFWAFEMERRGAAEVIAIDLDDPRRVDFSEPVPELSTEALADRMSRPLAFACAHHALGSSVERRDLSVYDLASVFDRQFDFAFIGTLLLHLREPLRALTAIRDVLVPGGRLLSNDHVSLKLSLMHPRAPVHALSLLPGKPFWWEPNARGLRRYVEKAGFQDVTGGGPYFLPRGPGYARDPLPRTLTNFAWRYIHEHGMVHAWASPRVGERPGALTRAGEPAEALTATVIVPARDAAETIEALLEALAAQQGAPPFEVIVVDSGSSDGTSVHAAIAGAKVLHNPGGEPAGSRNLGASVAFGDVLAFTDADCAPEPGWLAAGLRALGGGADLVQGAVAPAGPAGPFDRTVVVAAEHGLYETASLFVRRATFERVGGFEPVPGLGIGTDQPFGEDTWFAWRLKRAGGLTAFAADAAVRHEVFTRGPGAWIWEHRRAALFPPLVALVPELRSTFLHRRWFLSPASRSFDLALAGGVLGAVGLALGPRRRWAAAPLLLTARYGAGVAAETRARAAGPAYALARVAADGLTCAVLVAGSVRARTPVL